MKIINDPFALIIRAAKNLYPDIEADIQFNPSLKHRKFLFWNFGECGCTTFPDDGGTPLVDISTNIPFVAMAEILAHELAHIAAGEQAEHGFAWQNAFAAIHGEYDKLIEE